MAVPFRCVWDSFGFTWLSKVEATGEHRLVVVTTLRPGDGRSGKAIGTASYYSDDDGKTWTGPSNLVTTDEYPGRWYNPSGSGQVVELADGRLWMLTRSSQDHLWQAYSGDRGNSWKDIGPSRFVGVFSNVRLERIPGNRLLIVWLNNMPYHGITTAGSFHNTARDVLHAAISLDDGATWRGFREVILDRIREKLDFASPKAYDAGVHHPKFTVTQGGKVVVFSGQDEDAVLWGSPHRRAVIFDQQWLLETGRTNDFHNGTDDLCTALLSKLRWRPSNYYSRVAGARIVGHPDQQFRDVLQVGRQSVAWVLNEQEGATWNFPTGIRGRLETKILLRKGFRGGAISLTDTYYNPTDNAGEDKAMFLVQLDVGSLVPERWYDIAIEWKGTANARTDGALLYIDGALQKDRLPLRNASVNGINYVRFRSTAKTEDPAGFLVDHVNAAVSW